MTTKTKLHLLLLSLFVCIYLLPLGVRPLMEPDETRYGEIPREMIASGDWISPHLNGLRYFEKPPLGYWLNGLSIMACGENAFAIRLPSALSVGLSALVIMLMIRQACPRDPCDHEAGSDLCSPQKRKRIQGAPDARKSPASYTEVCEQDSDPPRGGINAADGVPCVRLHGDWAGPIAALVLLTCLEVAAVGTFSVLDSMLACTLTLTMACFFLASQAERGSSRQRWLLVGAGTACGLAFLTKGFLALVVPALSLGAYLAWERRWRDLIGLAWLPLLVATLTALPWSLAIHAHDPDFWNFFFWHEHVRRFLGGGEAQHPESFWFFFTTAPAMFLPWTVLIPAACIGLRSGNQPNGARQLIRFCLSWLCLPFLFFSLSSGKLLTYILPCFPPFAILVGLGLPAALRSGRQRLFQLGAWAAELIFGLLAVAFVAIQFVGAGGIVPPYAKTWQWLLAVASVTAMTLLPLAACRAQALGNKIILFGLSMTLLLVAAPFIIPAQAIEKKSPGALLLRHKAEISADTIVLSDEETVRAVCWFLQRADVLLVNGAGELSYGLNYPEAKARLLDFPQAKAKILANPNNIVLVVRAQKYRKWASQLPPPRGIDDNGHDGYVFLRY